MPLLYDEDEGHSNKRRRLNDTSFTKQLNMAGHWSKEASSFWQKSSPEKDRERGQEPQRKVEYAGEIVRTSSREELMECIKRGQRPTWVPNERLQALCDEEEALVSRRQRQNTLEPKDSTADELANQTSRVLEVKEPFERPRSALHRGNFAEEESTEDTWLGSFELPGLAVSSLEALPVPSPTYSSISNISTHQTSSSHRFLAQLNTNVIPRQRAPSLGSSLSSSFVMRAPTSPLVNATSNQELDPFAPDEAIYSRHRTASRRRTMPPNSFHSFSLTPSGTTTPNFSRPFIPSLTRELSLPVNSHRPRGSLTSFTYHPRSNPQTPNARSRRPSLSSDAVHRRRTSMVGSFEESIIRGRMSAPASRPFDFTAQIGVMGKGKCPANLQCPAHVTVPFSAVYYSYHSAANSRTVADDTPSPYVGTIDIRQKLKYVTLASNSRTRSADFDEAHPDQKVHVGGAYRVPQIGQLQIIIKSPNRTAVKLFLVPYDLTGMQASTKSFVRQRIFSTGPIIDSAVGNTVPPKHDPLADKHILRYLIHVKFCCPVKGRFYVYDDIRVVFANRVPDGKEKLRSELQHPEPMFTMWKSAQPEERPQHLSDTPTSPLSNIFSFDDGGDFRRSQNIPISASPETPTRSEHLRDLGRYKRFEEYDTSPLTITGSRTFDKQLREVDDTSYAKRTDQSGPELSREGAVSPVTGFNATPNRGSPLPWRSSPLQPPKRSFSPAVDGGNSLLSKQLRELQERLSLSREFGHTESE